jgi:hypothetical protein
MELAQDRVQWQAFVLAVLNLLALLLEIFDIMLSVSHLFLYVHNLDNFI